MKVLSMQKMSLYNVEWQALRVSLLGKWNNVTNVTENINVYLRPYLGEKPSKTKLWRVLNYLNAVRMGLSGQGKFYSFASRIVKDFRDEVQDQYNKCHPDEGFEIDMDDKIKADWNELDEKMQKRIYANLHNRLYIHRDSKYREELRHFLEIIK